MDTDGLQKRIEHYTPQLNGYRAAVAKFARLPIEKVSTRMLFVTTGQVVNLDLIETSVGGPAVSAGKRTEPAHSSGRAKKPKLNYSKRPAASSKKASAEPISKQVHSDSDEKRQKTLWD